MANTYVLIASQTLGSSAASVTFSSIPQTYTDLVLKGASQFTSATTAGGIAVRFNGDSSGNYSLIKLAGNGSAASSSLRGPNDIQILDSYFENSTFTANTFSNWEIYIPNYASTSARPISLIGASEANATTANYAYVATEASLYRGASGISSIVITDAGSNNINAGSTFYLYGIKKS